VEQEVSGQLEFKLGQGQKENRGVYDGLRSLPPHHASQLLRILFSLYGTNISAELPAHQERVVELILILNLDVGP
jgi:hypothetical protein